MRTKKKTTEKSAPTISKKKLPRDLQPSDDKLKKVRGGGIDIQL